jgi:hypothetical protein
VPRYTFARKILATAVLNHPSVSLVSILRAAAMNRSDGFLSLNFGFLLFLAFALTFGFAFRLLELAVIYPGLG